MKKVAASKIFYLMLELIEKCNLTPPARALALSLSNQSSLPVLLQRKLLTFSLTYELGNTQTCYEQMLLTNNTKER